MGAEEEGRSPVALQLRTAVAPARGSLWYLPAAMGLEAEYPVRSLLPKDAPSSRGGGIGDSIQLFPLILSLKNLYEKSEIYYLGAHENHYLGK